MSARFAPANVDSAEGFVPASARIALDCRWLQLGGAGRVTELLLRSLSANPPPGEWILWGRPELITAFSFPGSSVAPARSSPLRWYGQREIARVPAADVVVYMHQVRPLLPGRSITLIHDTIPLRFGGSRPTRILKRAFLLTVAHLSTEILTVSEFSRQRIAADLRVPRDRISLLLPSADMDRARRIAGIRSERDPANMLLYVGRFDRHKNLRALARAFQASTFAASGGSLRLVGGWGSEPARLSAALTGEGLGNVVVEGVCSDAQLDELMASALALALPSLEEGFGLPAVEAVACGLPVVASSTGVIAELPRDRVVLADPSSIRDLSRAIDVATSMGYSEPRVPLEADLCGALLRAVSRTLSRRGHE